MQSDIIRQDGRTVDQLREMSVVYERLDRVDGSARFGFGPTQCLASLSGPLEVRPNLESPSQATLEIHIRPIASVPGTDARALASTLKAILSPALFLSHHPRTLVQIVGQALCGSGSGSGTGSAGRGWNASLVASLINASSASLLNASSVPMKGVICAVAVGRLRGPNTSRPVLVLDPSEPELPELAGSGCFAFMFSSSLPPIIAAIDTGIPPCSLLWTNYAAVGGSFDEAELAHARQLAEAGAKEVWRRLKQSVGHTEMSMSPAVPHTRRNDVGRTDAVQSEGDVDDEKMEI